MNEDLVYMASFWEAEGNLSLTKNKKGLQFAVTQKIKKPLEIYLKHFGGKIYSDGKKYYKYSMSGNNAVIICKELLPYMRFRQDEVKNKIQIFLSKEKTKRGCPKKYIVKSKSQETLAFY